MEKKQAPRAQANAIGRRWLWGGLGALIVIAVLANNSNFDPAGENRTFEDALSDPPSFGGEYLNAQEFGLKIGHYLPIVSDLSPAQKLELCLEVAEEHMSDVTTPQQRKQGCSHYAIATKTDVQEAMNAFFDFMDKASPAERLAFCKLRGTDLFGKDATQEEAEEGCKYFADNWGVEIKNAIREQIGQLGVK